MNISTHSIESTNESRRRNKDKDKDGNVSVQRFHVGGSAFTPALEERGEREGMRGGGPGVIPRIISTAWLTRSALRFPVAGRSIGRSWLMMACENGKGADGKGRAASGFRSAKGGGGQKPDGSGKGRGGRGGSSRLLHHRSLDQSRSEVDEWEARTKIR